MRRIIKLTEMDDRVPCCALDAARKTKRLIIGGVQVGISNLDSIIKEVISLGLEEDDRIRDELLARVVTCNFVPDGAKKDYADALLREYRNRGH
jgi:hypothetical protein